MIEIKDLLGRFHNLLIKEDLKRVAVLEAIMSATKIQIKKEQIKIKNQDVFLDIKPIYKNEIFLKKEEISKHLENSLGNKEHLSFR